MRVALVLGVPKEGGALLLTKVDILGMEFDWVVSGVLGMVVNLSLGFLGEMVDYCH